MCGRLCRCGDKCIAGSERSASYFGQGCQTHYVHCVQGKRARYLPERRKVTWWDQVSLSCLLALLVQISVHIPEFIHELPWSGSPSVFFRLASVRWGIAPVGNAATWMLEFGGIASLFLAYFYALSGLRHPRLGLTRPLCGAAVAVAVVAVAFVWLEGVGISAAFLPVALPALWVLSSFGLGAGLVSFIALSAVSGALGIEEFFNPYVVARGLAMLLSSRGVRGWSGNLRAGLIASACSAVALGLEGRREGPADALFVELSLVALGGGAAEVVAFWLTKGAGDRLLGHVSRDRLVALLDLSQPLLERMMERAPGSFEHSRTMANLAEQAASSIGADALLTRVGAYYHDLGKSVEPKFFIENLLEGEASAHQGLTPLESATHIVRHVTEGVKILRDAGIPEPIVEFSYTHHGSQHVEYFLNQHKRLHPDGPVDTRAFAYPGMKPSTKETAILMLVDSIEAASRTIDARDPSKVREMVSRIIFSKLAGGQLDDSGLSTIELKILARRVEDTLVHMNHHRIKYPWQEDGARRPVRDHLDANREKHTSVFPRPLGLA